jgi:DNA-directed RNA polymerase specialized sigma24 family protein
VDQHDDSRLLRDLADGNDAALVPLMERYGDAIVETCFRATRDPLLALDLYSEVWAEACWRLRLPASRPPDSAGPWLVHLIGEVLDDAKAQERMPSGARARLRLRATTVTHNDIERLECLRDPTASREARHDLPRDVSAAADIMLLRVPEPFALKRIRPSALVVVERVPRSEGAS